MDYKHPDTARDKVIDDMAMTHAFEDPTRARRYIQERLHSLPDPVESADVTLGNRHDRRAASALKRRATQRARKRS